MPLQLKRRHFYFINIWFHAGETEELRTQIITSALSVIQRTLREIYKYLSCIIFL